MATFYSLFCYYSLYYVWNFFGAFTPFHKTFTHSICCDDGGVVVFVVVSSQSVPLLLLLFAKNSYWAIARGFVLLFFLKNIFSAMRNVDLTKGTVTKMFIKHYTIYMYNTRNAYWKNFSVSKLRCRVIS